MERDPNLEGELSSQMERGGPCGNQCPENILREEKEKDELNWGSPNRSPRPSPPLGIMGGTERLVCTQNGVLRPRLVRGVREGP